MGILDKLFGNNEPEPQTSRKGAASSSTGASDDEQAVARYRYMLQTAPPETIEQAHAEAFARLTPEQRQMLLQKLSAEVPEAERATGKDDPRSLARMATRAEVRQPGTMERTFGGRGSGMGLGGMMAGGFLSTIAGVVVGSAIAQSFLGSSAFGGGAEGGDSQNAGDADANEDGGESSAADAGDSDMSDAGDSDMSDGGDFGGDTGDF